MMRVGHRSIHALRAASTATVPAAATRGSSQRVAALHLGRASIAETSEFLNGTDESNGSHVMLRTGQDSHVNVTRRGIGSPYLWAKDMPRINASKRAVISYQSNFLQASINPYIDSSAVVTVKDEEKQSFVESLVLQEVIEDEGIPREALVVSAVLEDNLLQPAQIDPADRLGAEYIEKGLKTALHELDVEALDHLVVRVPEDLLQSIARDPRKTQEVLLRAAGVLEELCAAAKIQSFGFALGASAPDVLDTLIESSLLSLTKSHAHFTSLQLAMPLSSSLVPMPSSLAEFKSSRGLLVVADKLFDASLSNGKPWALRTYTPHVGEDIALLLKSAFNLAISIERKYMETVLPAHSTLPLPTAEDVAWAHILANQHAQFDNLEEWLYIRETQILPRFEVTIGQFDIHEDLKEFGFAYSMAMRELLKCFTASVELADASRAENLLTALRDQQLVANDTESLEQVAVRATLSAGADVVLFQEQLGTEAGLAVSATYSKQQLQQLHTLIPPFLVVE